MILKRQNKSKKGFSSIDGYEYKYYYKTKEELKKECVNIFGYEKEEKEIKKLYKSENLFKHLKLSKCLLILDGIKNLKL